MRANAAGLELIELFKLEYEPTESRTTVERTLTLLVKPRLTGNQFSALVCLGMCIGLDALKRIVRRINHIGPVPTITDDFHKFIYEYNERGERVVDPFLVKLRDAERDLFLLPELVKRRGAK